MIFVDPHLVKTDTQPMTRSRGILVIALSLLAISVVVHPVVDLLQTIVAPTHHSADVVKKLSPMMALGFQAILLVQLRSLELRRTFSPITLTRNVLENTCSLLC